MKKYLFSAALVAFAVAAHAQTSPVASMQQGLDMLRAALDDSLVNYGVTDVDVEALNLKQVVEIIQAIEQNPQDQATVRSLITSAVERD
jgi:molecular chaperone GrpE (heat shock protein)